MAPPQGISSRSACTWHGSTFLPRLTTVTIGICPFTDTGRVVYPVRYIVALKELTKRFQVIHRYPDVRPRHGVERDPDWLPGYLNLSSWLPSEYVPHPSNILSGCEEEDREKLGNSFPFDMQARPHYHWHMEIVPRLTRAAGFEWGTGFYINPVPPEQAAGFLREIEVDTSGGRTQ